MAMRWGISKPTSSPIRETLDATLTLRGLLQREGLNRGDDLCRAVPVEVACGQSHPRIAPRFGNYWCSQQWIGVGLSALFRFSLLVVPCNLSKPR